MNNDSYKIILSISHHRIAFEYWQRDGVDKVLPMPLGTWPAPLAFFCTDTGIVIGEDAARAAHNGYANAFDNYFDRVVEDTSYTMAGQNKPVRNLLLDASETIFEDFFRNVLMNRIGRVNDNRASMPLIIACESDVEPNERAFLKGLFGDSGYNCVNVVDYDHYIERYIRESLATEYECDHVIVAWTEGNDLTFTLFDVAGREAPRKATFPNMGIDPREDYVANLIWESVVGQNQFLMRSSEEDTIKKAAADFLNSSAPMVNGKVNLSDGMDYRYNLNRNTIDFIQSNNSVSVRDCLEKFLSANGIINKGKAVLILRGTAADNSYFDMNLSPGFSKTIKSNQRLRDNTLKLIISEETPQPTVSAPKVTAPPVTAPPVTAPPVTAPPVTAPPVTAPQVSAPPIPNPVATPNISVNPRPAAVPPIPTPQPAPTTAVPPVIPIPSPAFSKPEPPVVPPAPAKQSVPPIITPASHAFTQAPPVEAPALPPVDAPALPPTEAPTPPHIEAPALPPIEAPAPPPIEAPTPPPSQKKADEGRKMNIQWRKVKAEAKGKIRVGQTAKALKIVKDFEKECQGIPGIDSLLSDINDFIKNVPAPAPVAPVAPTGAPKPANPRRPSSPTPPPTNPTASGRSKPAPPPIPQTTVGEQLIKQGKLRDARDWYRNNNDAEKAAILSDIIRDSRGIKARSRELETCRQNGNKDRINRIITEIRSFINLCNEVGVDTTEYTHLLKEYKKLI